MENLADDVTTCDGDVAFQHAEEAQHFERGQRYHRQRDLVTATTATTAATADAVVQRVV